MRKKKVMRIKKAKRIRKGKRSKSPAAMGTGGGSRGLMIRSGI